MAGFAFMDITKIKSRGQMNSKFIHNCRKIQIDNVIPELTNQNETLAELPYNENGERMNYHDAFKQRIDNLDYYKDHNIRSNAVLGYEVLMTFTRDSDIDLNQWKTQSMEWLDKTFNVAPDKQSNILHAELHMDEVGSPHIHAFVVPIDERGRLNAKRFTDGSRAMTQLQTSYAKTVENTGLKRGIAGSSAKHQDIRRMYANLNNAMVLPEVKQGETAEEYRDRVSEQVKTAFARGMREVDDESVKRLREFDEQKELEHRAISMELNRMKKEAEHEVKDMETKRDDAQEQFLSYNTMVQLMLEQMAVVKKELQDREAELDQELNNENAREFYENIDTGLQKIYETDPEEAEYLHDELDYLEMIGIEERAKRESQEFEQENEQDTEFES